MTINILLNGCEWKKSYVEKRLLKMFLTEDEVLMGYRHWSKYQCEIFNFVDLRIGWALCGRPQPEHDSAVMPLLSLFPLNVLTHQKSILCQETFSESGLLHYFLFVYGHLIIMWSPMANLIPLKTLILTSNLHHRC